MWNNTTSLVMPNSYAEWRNFQLDMRYFIDITQKRSTVATKKLASIYDFVVLRPRNWLLSTTLPSTGFADNDVKTDVKTSNRRHDAMH